MARSIESRDLPVPVAPITMTTLSLGRGVFNMSKLRVGGGIMSSRGTDCLHIDMDIIFIVVNLLIPKEIKFSKLTLMVTET